MVITIHRNASPPSPSKHKRGLQLHHRRRSVGPGSRAVDPRRLGARHLGTKTSKRGTKIHQVTVKNGDFAMKNGDFATKNGDFAMKNCDFAMKNADFAMKNGDFANEKWVILP